MADSGVPLFSAVATSARQLYLLLRTISFGSKVQVRITPEGLRFLVTEPGVLEASISLPPTLFTSYRLSPSTSDAYSSSFAAHRLTRHSVFSPSVLGTQGAVRIVYRAEGAGLELSVPETGGVRTGAELATFVDDFGMGPGGEGGDGGQGQGGGRGAVVEGIPFDRTDLRIKVILPASVLGDAVGEIGALGPPDVLVVEGDGTAPYLVLRGEGGSGGECRIEFGDEGTGVGGGFGVKERSKLLETFLCEGRVRGRYAFGTVRKGMNAMRAGSKVSLRIDGQGVLSLQFLIEMGEEGGRDEVAFVDFRLVPLWEGEEVGEDEGSDTSDPLPIPANNDASLLR
ncbi:repair protein Rad1/Rec1/Rad17-domain-containing protein [Elsinoe ampelina]|uniref:Repair protein Rad1/Rec1/Rad17-domain-containing protein n=1 Tax=Elsinoe ampelina TaxID=302913 RepID=A0A6A6G9S6_9PEZI|nr:repair protein Rad1/Rec1/Rad17-domain-containing protein [Elsinoe ampelina]